MIPGNSPPSARPRAQRATMSPGKVFTMPMRVQIVPQASIMMGIHTEGLNRFIARFDGISAAMYSGKKTANAIYVCKPVSPNNLW